MQNVLGIDPGIANCGFAVVDAESKRILAAGVIVPASRRQTNITKTRTGKRKKTVVPGSLSATENDMQRCGVIFERLIEIVREFDVVAIAVEDRTVNAAWAASTKMTQTGVLVAVECCSIATGRPRTLLPVKDVHSILGIAIPRGQDAKPYIERVVMARLGDYEPHIIHGITPAGRRVHAYDAAAVALAAMSLQTSHVARAIRGATS